MWAHLSSLCSFFLYFFWGAFFNGILGLLDSNESLGFLVFSPAKIILFPEMLKFSSKKKEIPNNKIVGRKTLKIQEFFI